MKPERKPLVVFSLFAGIICLCMGYLMTYGGNTKAQYPDEYAGIQECNDCHLRIGRHFETSTHALTFLQANDYPEAIIADFTIGDDVRMYTFPDEHKPRPFTLDDIAFVVGSGKIAQRYVIEVESGDYRILPAEWDVSIGEWQTFPLPDGDSWENCATCHTTGYDANNYQWVDDGITCEACHGAGLEHVEVADDAGGRVDDEELLEIQSTITIIPDAEVCGTCHTRWTEEATCDDPVHCTDITYDAWMTSPHAETIANSDDLESAESATDYVLACSGCHGVHNEDITFPSLLLESPENMCLACHDNNADDLIGGNSIVDNVVGKPSAHHDTDITCESCHNTHAVTSIPEDPTLDTTCIDCHTDLTQNTMRDFVNGAQQKVATRLNQIDLVLDDVAPEWVHTVVTAIHEDGSGGIHNFAYVSRLLDAVEVELGIRITTQPISNIPMVTASDPTECAECHSDEHEQWQNSPHANASLGETFQQAYAKNGQPSYCMSCHASGYDATTQTYVFEGVVCSSCHTVEGSEHPPSPVSAADSSVLCGRCHSGEHSPEYNEWLVSDHSTFNVDCIDCHVAHDNGLRLGDVNTTCSDCHVDAMNDEIHMGEDMNCVDCHMTRSNKEGDVIHHTMFSDPKTCSDCHDDIHTLQLDPTRDLNDDELEVFTVMEEEIATLESKADTNLQSGIVGGAVGALVLVGLLFIVMRIGRMR